MGTVYKKAYSLSLKDKEKCDVFFKALANKKRRDILLLLYKKGPMSIKAIAFELDAPISSVSEDVSYLLKTHLVSIIKNEDERKQGKIITRQFEEIHINFGFDNLNDSKYNEMIEVPIGSYCAFDIHELCGMLSEEGYIGPRDNKICFYETNRFNAQLIWFDYGYLEYKIPFKTQSINEIESISFSMELCSEAPGYNHDWPSDIYFEVNDLEVGQVTCSGDFGDRQGKLSPFWWKNATSYGLMYYVKITNEGTFINEKKCSDVTLNDLSLSKSGLLNFRLGVKKNAKNRGGINLFGSKFGDYNQHIIVIISKVKKRNK